MKKINLKGISEVLSEKEMKNVMGGSDINCAKYRCGSERKSCCEPSDYCSSPAEDGVCMRRP